LRIDLKTGLEWFSLTTNVSGVQEERGIQNRFNGFWNAGKLLKRFEDQSASRHTSLKRGVDENKNSGQKFIRRLFVRRLRLRLRAGL
jgi:hypothetical protein